MRSDQGVTVPGVKTRDHDFDFFWIDHDVRKIRSAREIQHTTKQFYGEHVAK
jgi:hypothetical protein